MTTIRFDLLGPPELRVDGAPVSVDTRKALAVLARVVVEGPQRRDVLDALLWPESDAKRARAALRRTLMALRKVLPDGALTDGDEVDVTLPVETDLAEVEELVGDGRGTRDPGRLSAADALHRGGFLAGLHFRDADPFEHWRRDTEARTTRRHTRLLERWSQVLSDAHEFGPAIEVARARLALEPLHEPSHQQLMLLHAWAGDRAGAAEQFGACVRVLDGELGVAPLPRTVAMDRAIRSGDLPPLPDRVELPAPEAAPDATAARDVTDGQPAVGTATRAVGAPSDPATLAMLGRDDQLRTLLDAHASSGEVGTAVAVTGEAGIGKSRLVAELAARVGGPALQLVARDEARDLAYAPVTAALRELAPRLAELDEEVRSELARLDPVAAGVAPPTVPLTTPTARTRFVHACATALVRLLSVGDGPGLLVVEDLDRADRATVELVEYLAARVAEHPVLLVATGRAPGVLPSASRRLALGRLGPGDVAALAAAAGHADVAERLHAEAEGVPFLVVSYLAALGADAGADWSVPPDGRELVARRLAPLDEVATQVLATAAVLGESATLDAVEATSGRSDEEFVDAVEALVTADLLTTTADGLVAFTHRKIREVVLDATSPVRRRLLHRRAADVLAAASPPVAAGTLARHLAAAGRQDEAAEAHAAAGRRAEELYANEQAVAHLGTAVSLGHPDRAGLLVRLGDLHVRTGAYAEARQHYVRAAGHGVPVAEVEHRLGALAVREGEDAAAEQHLSLALEADPPASVRVVVLAELVQLLVRRGDLDRARDRAEEAVAVAEADGATPDVAARARNVAGLVARRRGDPGAARAHLRASLGAAAAPEHRAAALNNLALVLAEQGALDEALVVSRDALEVGRAVADRHREAALLSNLADLLHDAGRRDEALQLQAQAAERFAGVGSAPTTTPGIWSLVDW